MRAFELFEDGEQQFIQRAPHWLLQTLDWFIGLGYVPARHRLETPPPQPSEQDLFLSTEEIFGRFAQAIVISPHDRHLTDEIDRIQKLKAQLTREVETKVRDGTLRKIQADKAKTRIGSVATKLQRQLEEIHAKHHYQERFLVSQEKHELLKRLTEDFKRLGIGEQRALQLANQLLGTHSVDIR